MIKEPSHIISEDFLDTPGDDFTEIEFYTGDEETLLEVAKWADETCKGPWLIGWRYAAFYDKEDLVHFTLRWLEK